MNPSNPIDAAQLDRFSGEGFLMPTDATGLQRFWERYGGGEFGMPRKTFVAGCRVMIRNGLVSPSDRDALIASGWHELSD
jgi:hypothetical protein